MARGDAGDAVTPAFVVPRARASFFAGSADGEEIESYQALCRALGALGHDAVCFVHCWTVEPDAAAQRGLQSRDSYLKHGFDSLLFLAQALGEQSWVRACRIAAVSTNVT